MYTFFDLSLDSVFQVTGSLLVKNFLKAHLIDLRLSLREGYRELDATCQDGMGKPSRLCTLTFFRDCSFAL